MPVSWSEDNKREYTAKLECPHGCGKPLKATLVIRPVSGTTYDIDLKLEHES